MSERRKGERNLLGSAESPYSKGLMSRALTAIGLREDEAYELARRLESDLAQRSEVSVDLDRLGELATDLLGTELGPRTARTSSTSRGLSPTGRGCGPSSAASRPTSSSSS